MVAQARRWSDLTEKEKAMVIGGLAMAATMIIAIPFWIQYFIVEDVFHIKSMMASGARAYGMGLGALSVFLVFGLPMAIVGVATMVFLTKRSISLALKGILIVLAVVGAICLSAVLLVALFGILLSGFPSWIQDVSMAFSPLIIGIVAMRIGALKKVNSYLKRLEDQNKIW